MSTPATFAAFPWQILERHDGSALHAARSARRAFAAAVDPERLAAALGELVGVRCRCVVHQARSAAAVPSLPPVPVTLELADGSATVWLGFAPGLVTEAAARVLGRPLGIEDPSAPLGAALIGAAEALALEVARRAVGGPVAVQLGSGPPAGPGIAFLGTLHLGERAHPFGGFACWRPGSDAALTVGDWVARAGSLPLRLPLVVGESWARWSELRALARGDAWSSAGGLWIDSTGSGTAALAAPSAARGIAATLAPDGTVVVLGGTRALALDVEEQDVADGGAFGDDDSVTEVIFDAPVVVRVELGAVSMTAREWVELRPGDVIRTDRRIAAPAVLRVAGREVATGELVDVDGDLAVRILTLATGGGGS
jgi:flagellar motor switch/type III secretory pathway protein FliN